MEREEQQEKAEFVEDFGKFLADHSKHLRCKIVSAEFNKEKEVVTIHYTNGYSKDINVVAESCVAIMNDIAEKLLF